ncbi:hypothetical protein ACJRO7_026311 [Eucalyptus globulus]|uniref:CAP-Gly domain-containing protein n=1 Tax=Eucalyptus globulus TaxID=34317 RepID=A0ABD3JP22_EUCGL
MPIEEEILDPWFQKLVSSLYDLLHVASELGVFVLTLHSCRKMYWLLGMERGGVSNYGGRPGNPLGFAMLELGYWLPIIDVDPSSATSGGWSEDTSLVEKYQISDEAYDKHDGTFRKFKEKISSQNLSAFEPKITDNYMEDLCTNIKVNRCEVEPGAKKGVLKFVGKAESLAPGFWVGLCTYWTLCCRVKGTRYFRCPPLHGAVVRPDKLKVEDYPERDICEADEI